MNRRNKKVALSRNNRRLIWSGSLSFALSIGFKMAQQITINNANNASNQVFGDRNTVTTIQDNNASVDQAIGLLNAAFIAFLILAVVLFGLWIYKYFKN